MVLEGATQMGAAIGLSQVTGGLAAPLGVALGINAADRIAAGFNIAMTGNPTETYSSQLLQKTGFSAQTAKNLDSTFSFAGTLAAGHAIRAAQRTAPYAFERLGVKASTKNILAEIKPSMQNGSLLAPKREVGQIWSKTEGKTSVQNAYHHWKKHGREFFDLENSKQYVEHAHSLLKDPSILSKIRPNGEILRFDSLGNTFGSFTKEGVPKTMFKPKLGLNYWEMQ